MFGRYEAFLEDWVAGELKTHTPRGVMDKLFNYIYGGRWVPPSLHAKVATHNRVYPLADSSFVKKAQEVPVNYRIDDHCGYKILERLDPRLLYLPFNKWRWWFEEDGPIEGSRADWEKRAPLNVDTFSPQSVNWRQEVGGDLKQEFMEQILRNPRCDDVFQILDRDAFEGLFRSVEIFETRAARFMFSVYSATVLLSNEWLEAPESVPARPVTTRCDYRWFKVNRRVLGVLDDHCQRASRLPQGLPGSKRSLRQILGTLVGRRDTGLIEKVGARTPEDTLATVGSQSLTSFIRQLADGLEKVRTQFDLPREAWLDHLERFVMVSHDETGEAVTLRGLVEGELREGKTAAGEQARTLLRRLAESEELQDFEFTAENVANMIQRQVRRMHSNVAESLTLDLRAA